MSNRLTELEKKKSHDFKSAVQVYNLNGASGTVLSCMPVQFRLHFQLFVCIFNRIVEGTGFGSCQVVVLGSE